MINKYRSLVRRANSKKLEVSLTFDQFRNLKLQDCDYCGISEILIKFYCDKLNVNTPWMSIDRKDNDLGYTLDNCVSSCFLCNKIKGSFFTYEEMKDIGRNYVYPKFKKFEEEVFEEFQEWCELNVMSSEEIEDFNRYSDFEL